MSWKAAACALALALSAPALGLPAAVAGLLAALATLLSLARRWGPPLGPSRWHVRAMLAALSGLLVPSLLLAHRPLVGLLWLLGPCYLLAAPLFLWLFDQGFRRPR